jgi:predicted CopG family antitoxin
MAEDNNGSATDSPIIIDMGKKKKKDIKRLRKGKGKLMSDVDNCIQELREAGEITSSVRPVVVVVTQKQTRQRWQPW